MEKYENLTQSEIVYLIEYHNKLYWNDSTPEISDAEYDTLLRCLSKFDPHHPLLTAIHTPEVATLSEKVKHTVPMLSLNKAYSLAELLEWANKYARGSDEKFLIQPKYDGISANYENGILATRGDGFYGENITDKISLIELEAPGYKGELNRPARGEIIIRNDDFKNIYSKIKRADGSYYKNSRNAVAGIMTLKDISDIKKQGAKLTLVDYELVSYYSTLSNFERDWQETMEKIQLLPYPMDGMVIKLYDKKHAASLGSTAHHPRGEIAFKFTGVKKETKLLDVQWSFGKNCITPVAVMEPIDINGSTIRHATLHNVQNIIDKNIMIGDTVTVERAGDVIPYIVSAIPGEERKSCLINKCPACDSELERRGPELCCTNSQCPEMLLQRLLASVRSIGIERLGEPTLRKLIQTLNVSSLKDIFNLKYEDVLKLEGFKDKSAANLVNEIDKARTVSDFQVLVAMNIPGIGPNVAKLILTEFSIEKLRSTSEPELSSINGIGPERAAWIVKILKEQSYMLDEILSAVKIEHTDTQTYENKDKICFTGKMPEQRAYYEKIAREKGFAPVKTVTSDLAILVADNLNGTGTKLKKARNYGIKIMALNEWLNSSPENSTKKTSRQLIEKPEKEIVKSKNETENRFKQMDFGF